MCVRVMDAAAMFAGGGTTTMRHRTEKVEGKQHVHIVVALKIRSSCAISIYY